MVRLTRKGILKTEEFSLDSEIDEERNFEDGGICTF
jgi:hypothetical protein